MDLDADSYRYRVRSVALVTPVIRELWLEPIDALLPFRAGQYVLLADDSHAIPQRSYSVANAPRADGRLSLLVTRVPGGPTSMWAHGLSMDDEVSVEGPFGTFVAPDDASRPVLLLGAGSGLAPLRALTEELTGTDRCVTLFFSGRADADAIDRKRFEALAATLPAFDYRLTCTRDARAHRHTRIPALLAGEFDTLIGTEVFAAGPPGFVAGCRDAVVALGADPARVRTEEFFAADAEWTTTQNGQRRRIDAE